MLGNVLTGVSVAEQIAEFEKQPTGSLPHLLVVTPPLPANRIAGGIEQKIAKDAKFLASFAAFCENNPCSSAFIRG